MQTHHQNNKDCAPISYVNENTIQHTALTPRFLVYMNTPRYLWQCFLAIPFPYRSRRHPERALFGCWQCFGKGKETFLSFKTLHSTKGNIPGS